MKRIIQTHLQNTLAEMILKGDITDGSSVHVSEKNGALDFKIGKPASGKVAA